MCGGKLADVIPCSCTTVKLTKMEKEKQSVGGKLLKLPAALKKLKKNSHPKSLYSINTKSTPKAKDPAMLKSNVYLSNSEEILCNENNKESIPSGAVHNEPTRLPCNKRSVRSIIPSPILDENLQTQSELEYNVRHNEQQIFTEKIEDESFYQEVEFELSPLELIGLYCSESDSVCSTVDLDSIVLEEKSRDIGPEPVLIEGDGVHEESKMVMSRRKPGLAARCRSMYEINRRVCALDDILYSFDLECGVGDIGPQPEALLDNYQEQTTTTDHNKHLEKTSNQPTLKKSDSNTIIDSIFTPQTPHSCCKRKSQMSWNKVTKRRRAAHTRINQVPRRRPRKVVFIGDMCSGKSSLISAYCKDRFNETYVPTILRSCLTDASLDGQKVELVVIEVSGRDDYAKLRQCAYHKTDAIVLCYSCDNMVSLNRIHSYWLPEIEECVPNVARILVGTRKDVRENSIDQFSSTPSQECQQRIVSESLGKEMSERIGAEAFIECSSRYRDGTRLVFETVAKVAMQKSRRKRKAQRTGDICGIM